MSTTLMIIAGLIALFIGFIGYNFYRMKNLKDTPDHANIRVLTNKNFKAQLKSGIVLVDFWAPWCGPCKMMAPVLNDIAETSSDIVTIAKVNVDQNQQLAQKFNIRNIPTLVMYSNGKEVNRFTGIKTKKIILKAVQDFLNKK